MTRAPPNRSILVNGILSDPLESGRYGLDWLLNARRELKFKITLEKTIEIGNCSGTVTKTLVRLVIKTLSGSVSNQKPTLGLKMKSLLLAS